MQVEIIKPDQLTAAQIAAWEEILRTNSSLSSPFFRPEFCRLVSRVVDHVEIAVITISGQIAGFFPYQRHANHVARPVGSPLSDYQGLIVPEKITCSIPELMKLCGLQAFYFDNLVGTQESFADYQWYQYTTHRMDLQQGYDAYCESKQRAGCTTLKKTKRKAAKLENAFGPLQLIPVTTEEAIFTTLVNWKREQYQRCGCIDYLTLDWVVELLREVMSCQQPQFQGMLSALYAGRELIALHLGLRSNNTLHGWFPVYNLNFSRYSPGLILWYELARQAEELGFNQIDLAKGNHRFKKSLGNATGVVAEGAYDARTAIRTINHGVSSARHFLADSTLGTPIKQAIKATRDWVSAPFKQHQKNSMQYQGYDAVSQIHYSRSNPLLASDWESTLQEVSNVS